MKSNVFGVIVALSLLCCAPLVATEDWKDEVRAKVLEGVKLSKTGSDRLRITETGTVFVIQKDGVSGNLASDMTILRVSVTDGEVAQAKGFFAAVADKKTNRDFKQGERVYLFKVDVKDDALQYWVISCDTFDVAKRGSTEQTRYKAVIDFKIDKAAFPTMTGEALKAVVSSVLVDESAAKAAATKTVELGQTTAQVEAILGRPDKILNLGPKTVYVYRDMKVIFLDGKVSDVQ
jgi:hypothetical protein